ncbi:MAG: ATP-dependent Clp protease adaptor ClpS, partial [Flavobacteriales bacterium]|nr:ATP-dependent Clp protease adaptor ClpS [Flavobacteriales bacterium]
MWSHHSPEEALLEEVLCETGPIREIILHNDDVNTFDHVIECLVEICGHDP